MDGIELARRATELDPDIKVMFITGFAAVALNPDNNAPKQAKILSKPFHLKDLVTRFSGFWPPENRRPRPRPLPLAPPGRADIASIPAVWRPYGRVAQRESTTLTW